MDQEAFMQAATDALYGTDDGLAVRAVRWGGPPASQLGWSAGPHSVPGAAHRLGTAILKREIEKFTPEGNKFFKHAKTNI
jgi:hypothetical protein